MEESPAVKKINNILKTDYSDAALNEGQDWYISGNGFLSLEHTETHLKELMRYSHCTLKSLKALLENIDWTLDELETTGNLFCDVLEIGEAMCLIDMFCEEYRESYQAMAQQDDYLKERYAYMKAETGGHGREHVCEIDPEDLPF